MIVFEIFIAEETETETWETSEKRVKKKKNNIKRYSYR